MTSIDKSPEQLDAEAAGPQLHVTLPDAIALHRALWQDDNRIPRLASRQPPVVTDESGQPETQETHTGMPISAALTRRIFTEWPGAMYPWVTALKALRQDCRRRHYWHRGADRPYWRGSLCWQAVHTVIVREYSVSAASDLLRADRLEDVLLSALAYMERHIDEQQARQEQRQKHDRGVFVVGVADEHEHHAVPGLHAAECDNPKCRRAA